MKQIYLLFSFMLLIQLCIAQRSRMLIKANCSWGRRTLYPLLALEYGKGKNSIQFQAGGGKLSTYIPTYEEYSEVNCSYEMPPDKMYGYGKRVSKVMTKGFVAKLFYTHYVNINNNRQIGLNGWHFDAGLRFQNLHKRCDIFCYSITKKDEFILPGKLDYYTYGPLARVGYQFIVLKCISIEACIDISFNYTKVESRDIVDPLLGNLFEFTLGIGKVFPYKK